MTPRSRAAWRNWLVKYHQSVPEVWLVFYKRGTGKPTLTYNDAVEEALCFGWIDGVRRSIDEQRYTHRFSPRRPNSKWSERNKQRIAHLMETGAMTPAGLRLVEAAKRNGRWMTPARPEVKESLPADLAARLQRSRTAAQFFHSLAPSYRRQYIAWITTAKREQTRTQRLDRALKLLEQGKKLGMV